MNPNFLRGALAALALAGAGGSVPAMSANAPEFTHASASEWINSPPLTLHGLRGKVVLVEFWTFDCYNCRNTLPWLQAIHTEYAPRGLEVIGVHTPELPQERVPDNVRTAVKELGIPYPVMLDADFSYWRALNNRYWPAFYLVDRDGRIALAAFGELHRGTERGNRMEARIRELLATGAGAAR
jgi:thiol-disulfide isomerase/thioredoxin